MKTILYKVQFLPISFLKNKASLHRKFMFQLKRSEISHADSSVVFLINPSPSTKTSKQIRDNALHNLIMLYSNDAPKIGITLAGVAMNYKQEHVS